ncbi:hypothetical protein GM658_07620 [Pseudoduganella eburnea]|uniref:Uncharacterized protein n=1 Tax=Massilia eburnea TaxID=1776165 RepID=A0A6L6QE88_9BURK|nr:hypothetical protein [Massilia eburnea]MTW10470.1 hypothetical protein [Massilia eburnea]
MNQDMADVQKQLRDLSYELRMLSINIDYLFANQRHLIEYLASMTRLEVGYRGKDILNRLDELRRQACDAR